MKPPRRPRTIPGERVRPKIRKALASADQAAPVDLDPSEESPLSAPRTLPDWVGRFGMAAAREGFFLWCEPRPDAGETFPSQVILDLPPGRYLVDILDVSSGRWISRESAAGGPLVAGLPWPGGPALVLVRPVPGPR